MKIKKKKENKAKETKTKPVKRKKKCRERLIIVCTHMYLEYGSNVPLYLYSSVPGSPGCYSYVPVWNLCKVICISGLLSVC